MKLLATLAAGTVALAALATPAMAQHSTTTVTRVHGPVKLLPHHKRKVCQTKYVAHHRVRKCYYR